MRDDSGRIDHFEGVAVNITAQRDAAKALQRAKDEADAASRAKSTFLASMSHELRTPLNGILGYAQILKRDDLLNSKQRDAVGVIHSSADHLLSLINDVLDLSNIEARKLELLPTTFDLADFAQAIANVFVPKALEKNLTLETVFDAELPRLVKADEQRMRQVVFNLVGNAIKFTASGGVVFALEKKEHRVRISVRDSGPGIAVADLDKLFQPFTQVGEQSQRRGGTGLGLAISRSIVEQMGGVLICESQPGVGSVFWFELEMQEVESAVKANDPSSKIIGYQGARRRILVADDHPANRSLLVDLLAPLGFEITTAEDGQKAIDQTIQVPIRPDLVLLDLRMPRVDGLVAAKTIQNHFKSKNENPPILVGISASAFHVDRQTFLDAGCVDFVAKPFREDQMLGLIGHYLGITWTYFGASSGETQFFKKPGAGATSTDPTPPSKEVLETLQRLASSGDVLGVKHLAEELGKGDSQLVPFSHMVVDLASRYKMKAIRQLLSRY